MFSENWLKYQHMAEDDVLAELLGEELERRIRCQGPCASRTVAKKNMFTTVVLAVLSILAGGILPVVASIPVILIAFCICTWGKFGCAGVFMAIPIALPCYLVSMAVGTWSKLLFLAAFSLIWVLVVYKQSKAPEMAPLIAAAKKNPQKNFEQIVEEEMFSVEQEHVPGSRKPILAVIMATAVLLGCFFTFASFDDRFTSDTSEELVNNSSEAVYTWELGASGYILVDFDAGTQERNPNIPHTHNGYPVVAIGERAFQNEKRITDIVIPDSVTEIGSYAFKGCTSLKSIVMGDQVVSIGGEAFYGCKSLTFFVLPAGVTEVRGNLFQACAKLTDVTLHEEITAIHAFAFNGCKALRQITLPSAITEIRANTFENCSSLESIVIPEGVTRIAAHAFRNCSSLAEVDMPLTVTEIGSSAFRECTSLKEITIPKECAVDERSFKDSPTKVNRSKFTAEQWQRIVAELAAKESGAFYYVYAKDAGPEKVFYPGESGQIVVADSDLFEHKISSTMALHPVSELTAFLEQMQQQGAVQIQHCAYSEIASEILGEPWFGGINYTIDEFLEMWVEEP